MEKTVTITIKCPHCQKPFPDKIGKIKIENTDQLEGFVCTSCGTTITKEDIAVIDRFIKRQYEKFQKDTLNALLKKSGFKL